MQNHDKALCGQRVLVVEDEYLLADEFVRQIERNSADVLGPVKNCAAALEMLLSGADPDIAILDLDLGGERSYPVADALLNRHIPFVFATGLEAEAIQDRYRHIDCIRKPYAEDTLVAALEKLARRPAPSGHEHLI
jgi:CheY-like chemotaxis protein